MWKLLIEQERKKDYFKSLMKFLSQERKTKKIYPEEENVFNAYYLVPYDKVKVMILGQDPYHQKGQAMGLSFSVPQNVKPPKSLINIFKELKDDLGLENTSGDLTSWAHEGVFLLNAVLTVEDSSPASHAKKGWETFTDATISYLSLREEPIVFILWGKFAQTKIPLIASHHHVISSPHPSPLGAYRGFWGSKPFSRTNDFLIKNSIKPIDWSTH